MAGTPLRWTHGVTNQNPEVAIHMKNTDERDLENSKKAFEQYEEMKGPEEEDLMEVDPEEGLFVLYQKWPDRRYRVYGINDDRYGETVISTHRANEKGLKEAIKNAELANALLIGLPEERFLDHDEFTGYCRFMAGRKRTSTRLFTPLDSISFIS